MSSVNEVREIVINGSNSSQVDNEVRNVEIITAGTQGQPGVKNVYVQPNDPSLNENGDRIWGMEEKGFIWVQI